MHQIAFMLVLGSTSGLFGRNHVQPATCPNGTCSQYVAAPAPTYYAPKYGQPVAPTVRNSYYYAPQAAPAAAPAAVAPRPTYYYYPAAPAQAATCPTGTCPYSR
jgi:hypothetical protein